MSRCPQKGGDEVWENKHKNLVDQLSSLSKTAITKATNAYLHTPQTIAEIDSRINVLDKIKSNLEEEEKYYNTPSVDKEYIDRALEIYKQNKTVSKTIAAYKMAKESSSLLQEAKFDKYSDMDIFSAARSLIHLAQGLEKTIV